MNTKLSIYITEELVKEELFSGFSTYCFGTVAVWIILRVLKAALSMVSPSQSSGSFMTGSQTLTVVLAKVCAV